MAGIPSGFNRWVCPFCGSVAARETEQPVLCDSRTCSCGAIGLAAPTVDTDEIVDDALGLFRVRIREESRGYDALMLEDLRRTGVEVREGEGARIREGFWGQYTSLWFRRTPAPAERDAAPDRGGSS
jgi:hypothetical protein